MQRKPALKKVWKNPPSSVSSSPFVTQTNDDSAKNEKKDADTTPQPNHP
jgi:hypothetical protein